MNDIAANIKALRREKGLSQDELARRLHVTRQTVSAWERGISRPGLDALGQIARALETGEDRLLYGGEEQKRPSYRAVPYWPVLGVIPGFLFVTMYFIWPVFGMLFGNSNEFVLLLAGQTFLAALVTFCYCALKDEIRNQKFYEQSDPEAPAEQPSFSEQPKAQREKENESPED